MSHCLSIRALRQQILAQSTSSSVDEVELDMLRQEIAKTVQEIRQSINRVLEFASRGLVGEAASLAEDFPDLAAEALALTSLPASDPTIARVWSLCIDPAGPLSWILEAMPRESEIDIVAMQSARMQEMRGLLDAYRSAALRQESIVHRLHILRKLRALDESNRMWLDQIQTLETEWLKWAVERARAEPANREELEAILSTLKDHQWLASVPRGLKEDIYARLKPMRAETAGQRYEEIAGRVHSAASNLDWDAIRLLEAEWAGVYHETGRMPDDSLQAQVQVPFDALTARDQELRRLEEFNALCDTLERELDQHPPSARAPNEPAIERALQAVQDFGISAPQGLVERAIAHLDSITVARRRRFRVTMVAALLTAAVVTVTLGLAIRFQSLRTAEESSRAALLEHVEAKRWTDGQALAEEIRRSFGTPDPTTVAALKKHDEGYATWKARQESIASELKAVRKQLGIDPNEPDAAVDRKAIADVRGKIAGLRSDVETDEHRGWLKSIDEKLAAIQVANDADDKKQTEAALAACDRSLEAWKTPENWTPEQRIAQKRWAEYEKALESALRGLEDARADVAGFEDGENDLARKMSGLEERLREAKTRQATLAEAERFLAPESIGKPVSFEPDFVSRIEEARKRFGDVLAVRREVADWEAASAMAPAWIALQEWRDVTWARLSASLKGDFTAVPTPDAAANAMAILDEHLGKHPDSPLRANIETLKERLKPGPVGSLWTATDLQAALEQERLEGIERVEILNVKGRYFFRRAFDKNTKAVNNAIQSVGDLAKDPMSDTDVAKQLRDPRFLSSIQLKPGEFPATPQIDPISGIWSSSLDRARNGKASEVFAIIIDLLQQLRESGSGDAFFQLYALNRATDMLERSGHLPPELAARIAEWRERLRLEWSGARNTDWARAAIKGPTENRKEREQAAEALRNFPDVRDFLRTTGSAKQKIVASLGPFAPVGVLLPADADGTRRMHGQKLSGDVALVRKATGVPGGFELVSAKSEAGVVDTAGLGIPKGPVLVFRRISR
jgi:hypothetical protein